MLLKLIATKRTLKQNTTDSTKIVSDFEEKRLKVDKLISDSEKALGLKSSEGMIAALSVQYDKEDSSKKRKQWLNGSIAFLIIAFIGGASFSAKQYLRQKNLADNYGYKLVLAKSIVAFAQEIKKHDTQKAAEYMNEVLSEINKSPIPSSKQKSEGITSNNIGLLEKIIDKVKSK